MLARIDSRELKRVITALKPFTAQSNYNILMGFIHFECKDNEIKFEALDGHRIGIEYLSCEADGDFCGYIRPIKIEKVINEKCEIELRDNKAFLDIDDIIYRFIQPDGKWYDTTKMFKDWEDIEPKTVGINATLLEESLKHQLYKGNREIVKLELRGNKDAVIIRNMKDERNVRAILPVNI